MELIERVARALAQAKGIEICSDASYAMSSFREPALAAIRAMLDGVEPCAWAYVNSDGECEQIDFGGLQPQPEFTPLYSLDALKEAL